MLVESGAKKHYSNLKWNTRSGRIGYSDTNSKEEVIEKESLSNFMIQSITHNNRRIDCSEKTPLPLCENCHKVKRSYKPKAALKKADLN